MIPSVEQDRIGVLAAYLRTNRDRFTDDALRQAAREAGYTDAEITAAWSAAADPRAALPTERRTNLGVVIVTAIAYAIVIYGGAAVVGSIGIGDLAALVALVLVVGGIAGWALLRDSRPSLASGLGWGVFLAVGLPLIVILGILGICVVAGTTGTFMR
jgi:hypothetical protein